MNRQKKVLLTIISTFLLSSCINQGQMSAQQENALGAQQERALLSKVQTIQHGTYYNAVRRVGSRIARVANRPNFQWSYHLIKNDKQANAFVLPGGKIFVYTGLFKYAANEAQLAAVVGHEVAHALKSHGVKGAQRKQNAGLVGVLLQVGMGVAGVDPALAKQVNQVYGQGATLGYIRPYSRQNESEADSIGLMLMAKAGYDPREALRFWEKFARQGQYIPEYLSTHPAPETRIENLRRLMPQAVAIYNQYKGRKH
ncbi:MAG: M48 family peptidase [Sulfurovum sp.]|nr:MAG: M48 family peptidase [Sulfurovum sp.]